MNRRKLLKEIIGNSKNIRFSDMVNIVRGFGFVLSRTEGSHHIFVCPDIPELVNLQNVKGQAKPYQIRQFLKLVEKHNLKLEDE
ncbi:MAG: type II toxin-antitoxin system HicA family toxin [Nitrospirae bacterium]|nr:type II toxin-antitoxin system HicA family toxin [Nitrospirota bacterium]